MNICKIILPAYEFTNKIEAKSASLGFSAKIDETTKTVVLTHPQSNIGRSTLTYQRWKDSVTPLEISRSALEESFSVSRTDTDNTLIFSRVYWPSYQIYLNELPIETRSYKNALLMAIIPAGQSGKLTITYETASWKYTKWILLFGLCGLIAAGIWLRDMEHEDHVMKGLR